MNESPNENLNDGADLIKAEVYDGMAVINRAFEQITTTLYNMEAKGLLAEDYAYSQEVPLRELAARINCYILSKVSERELDDRKHYSLMRADLDRKNSRKK